MRSNLLFVINPAAGSIDAVEVEAKARKFSERFEFDLEFYFTTGTEDAKLIKEKLASKTFHRVIVAGGDGTINMVASQLLTENIILGILACGSANGLLTSLDYPKTLDEQFEVAFSNHTQSIDALCVNDTVCLHIADIGINAELIYNYEKSNSRGMFGYAKHSLPTLLKSDYPYKFKIHLEDKVIKSTGVLLAFANTKKYGTGANINPIGKIDDGLFELILYKKLSVWEILKTFFNKTSNKEPHISMYQAQSVKVTSENPIALQVDGEFIGEFDTFSAEIIPKCLQLALPKR
ncbi:MAG: diacylglycerol kinase family lipid kinase [Flavobacteriales bacterium]|jgi:diacylglycerol kinase (ATP)|uniref:diacylglycerol/lipid kinase family protein n=1 Tax=Candidatus Ulvibacter alkanivorans TaxID=2267620 RepID=UPI000DF2697F|nr:diacylglycerol kinase family protein [Candidatus Ulvibacter alkanivorans]MCH2489354.1 diacylglycerol kinase family lipid kinase [Flavobacteriales bacterium]